MNRANCNRSPVSEEDVIVIIVSDKGSITDNDAIDDSFRLAVLNDYFDAQSAKLPKSARLYEACLKMIERGYWVPGDRVPSEKKLSKILPVGLSTVQIALGRLADTGLIQRKRKAGSFICEPDTEGREFAYFLFLDDDSETYLPVSDIQLEVYETRDRGAWSDFLGPTRRFVCIERVLNIGGEFLIHNKLYVGDPKFRPLLNFSPSELKELSFRILFQDRFGAPPLGSNRSVQFTRLDAKMANKLEQQPNSPAFLYEVRQFTLRNEPLLFMQTIVPENGRTLRISTHSY